MSFFRRIFSEKGISVFDEYDTEMDDYQLLVKNIREENSTSNYFLDDPVLIRKLHQKWKFPTATSICRGGYDYSITLFKGNQIEKLMLVCFQCDRLVFESLPDENNSPLFELSRQKFHSLLREDFNLIDIHTKKFSDKTDAIKFWEDEQKKPLLIKQPELRADWMKFEGRYTLSFSLVEKSGEYSKPTAFLEKKMANFEDCGAYRLGQLMKSTSENKSDYIFVMNSSKKLYDNFEAFEPTMLAKNLKDYPTDFFLEAWTEFDSFDLPLHYKKK